MAHIEKRGPSRWRARYYDPDGRERSKTFSRKTDAEKFLATVQTEIMTGRFVDPTEAKTTLQEYAESWRVAQVHRDSTGDVTESRLRLHVYPTFGNRQLGSIRPTEVQGWVRKLGDDLSPRTVEAVYRLLASVYKAAIADRMVTVTPCVNVRVPKKVNKKIVPLPVLAVQAFHEVMPERARATVTVAAGTGLRQGELLGLTLDRVNFLRREITVDRQLVTPKSGAPAFGPPKTEASYRTVPLPRLVVDELAAHLARWPVENDFGLLFTNSAGEPWRRNRFAETWRAAVSKTAWPTANFHELRHHYASLLIGAGCSVKVVQEMLGHANASETLDTYSHLWPDDDERVRDAIDKAFEDSDDDADAATGTEQG